MSIKNQPLWRFIPLAQYSPPAEPTTQTIRNTFHDLVRRLGLESHTDQEMAVNAPDQQLSSIPDHLIERAAPEPDWLTHHCLALDAAFSSWRNANINQAGVRVIVRAPHSKLSHSIRTWAVEQKCTVIEAPTSEQIIAADSEWLKQLQSAADSHWVLPFLERCFLRHQTGLHLLRQWLNWAVDHPAGLLVCDSWAWAYLSQTLHLNQILPHAETLAPFDGDALNRWLQQLAQTDRSSKYTFRQANSGNLVFTGTETESEDSKKEARAEIVDAGRSAEASSAFLKHLAARSRGIPEIAWRIWRQSLLVESDEEVEETAEEKASGDQGRTIWVHPWDQVELPATPGVFGINEALVLHTLLLHAGLPGSALPTLVPLMPFEIASSLRRSQTAALITARPDFRAVSETGYFAVRDFLRNEGFLIDQL